MKKIAWEHWDSFTHVEHSEDDDSDWGDEPNTLKLLSSLELGGMSGVDTPLGRYLESDSMLPSKMFDCWIMYTNFDIDAECVRKIAKTPGVEVASVMTRYRVFIGIGKLFDASETKFALQCELLKSGNQAIVMVDEDEAKEHKYWAGIITEDGNSHYICTNTENDEEYLSSFQSLKQISEMYEYEFRFSGENDV